MVRALGRSGLITAMFEAGLRCWFLTWLGFRKENPAADCNFKLSFQQG
jgi:hypothetical protein